MNKINFNKQDSKVPLQNTDQITPQSYNIPSKIGSLKIKKISWENFKGKKNSILPYSAHIYWHIQYQILQNKNGKEYVTVDVNILPKSWVLQQNKSQHLLRHQYGHYLIGCLCAIQFQRKVNHTLKMPVNAVYRDWIRKIFNDTLQQYLKAQKLYDDETNHRLNFSKQDQWQNLIARRFKMQKEQKKKVQNKDRGIYKLPRIRSSAK